MDLFLSKQVVEKIEKICSKKNISAETFIGECVCREYKRMQKAGEFSEPQLPGQMNIDDYGITSQSLRSKNINIIKDEEIYK